MAWEGSGIKPETMHPVEQWETLFAEIILSRGADHCRKKVVEDLRQDETKNEADVAKPEVNLIHIALSAGCISDLTCNCPYAADGKNCKHIVCNPFIAWGLTSLRTTTGVYKCEYCPKALIFQNFEV